MIDIVFGGVVAIFVWESLKKIVDVTASKVFKKRGERAAKKKAEREDLIKTLINDTNAQFHYTLRSILLFLISIIELIVSVLVLQLSESPLQNIYVRIFFSLIFIVALPLGVIIALRGTEFYDIVLEAQKRGATKT